MFQSTDKDKQGELLEEGSLERQTAFNVLGQVILKAKVQIKFL